MSDLVERLRTLHRALDGWEGGEFPILVEAADEIARLTAEVERMQALGEQSMIVMEAASRTIDAYKAVVDAARFFVRLTQPQSEDFDYLHDEIARKTALGQLEREVRALDGEP